MQLEDGNAENISVYAHRTTHLLGDGCDKFIMRVALCIFLFIMHFLQVLVCLPGPDIDECPHWSTQINVDKCGQKNQSRGYRQQPITP